MTGLSATIRRSTQQSPARRNNDALGATMGDTMTEQQMIEDGWRRCAVGQRDTQHCGLVEEARAQERARIVALIREHIALCEGQWIGLPADDDDDFDEVIALKRLLRQVEETSHE
jgi:hypothetical protein